MIRKYSGLLGFCIGACLTVSGQMAETAQTPPSPASRVWTLKECIDYAIEHNIEVRQRVLEKRNQELNVNTAQYSRLPDLNAGLGQNFYFGRGPGRDGTYQDQSQSSSSLDINTRVPVFSGFRVHHQIQMEKLNLQAAIAELDRAKEDLSLNITSYFLQVLFNHELYRIAEEQVRLNREQVERTGILVRGGKVPESELFDARASLAKEELNKTQAQNTLKLSLLDLSQLLNLETVEGFEIEMPDIEHILIEQIVHLMTPESVFTASVKNRPAVMAAEFRLRSSEKNLKIAKSAYYPQLSLGASYSNSYYHTYNLGEGGSNPSFSTQLSRNGSESVGLNLSIPIFNRMSTRNQVRSARISIENQELMLENMRQNLYKEIQQAYYNAVAAHEKYLSSEKSVEASRTAFRYEEQKYNAGRSTSYQFNDAKTRLAKSLSEAAQAKYDFIFRTKILDFYNGRPLDE